MDFLLLGFAWYIVFVFSLSVHEASHAFAAMKFGDNTAFLGGQVTLHPWPHITREPIGAIAVPIVSYLMGGYMVGWASAPYDPYWAARNPKKAAYMGLAGPASNLGLVVIAGFLIRVGIFFGLFYAPETINFSSIVKPVSQGMSTGPAVFLSLMFSLNCVLFVFNLLPIPPLDGTALMELSLKDQALDNYRKLTANPSACLVGLIIAWTMFNFIFDPIHTLALNLLYPGSNYH